MANFFIKFYSNSLKRTVSFEMFIPNDIRTDIPKEENIYWKRNTKTLFLLHGYTGSTGNWGIDEIARKYNFAMVMPNGENAFYLNGMSSGHDYMTYLGEELTEYIRKTFGLAKSPEDTFIMGMSMGGFGAIHTALKFPSTFGKAVGMSSALIVHDIAHMKQGEENAVANYAYYHECFGDLETVEERDTNPEVLAKKILSENKKVPKLYLCCGTEDFLLSNNRNFHEFLKSIDYPHEYFESHGGHDGIFWDEYTKKAVKWLFEK